MALGILHHHELLSLAEADPHQPYPKPPIPCLHLTNMSCVVAVPKSHHQAEGRPEVVSQGR